MINVPLEAVESQTLSITLNKQPCQISVRENNVNLYFDLVVNSVSILTGKICRNRQRLLLGLEYRGFKGDFLFLDTQGDEQPAWKGLQSRWYLYYLNPNE